MDKVVKSIEKLQISNRVNEHLKYTHENYIEYLKKLKELDDRVLKMYLKTLKNRELINNQETESEPSILIELFLNSQRKNSIEIAMQHFADGKITKEELKKLHRIVIKNSADDKPENYNFRQDNKKWVGYFGTGGAQRVDYYPPEYKDIDGMLDFILEILNDDESSKDINQTLIKPFVVHGFLGYLQAFGNGNTRLARVLQHGKIWHMTEKQEGVALSSPAIYLSQNYLLTRHQYRELMKGVAINQDWDAWLNYNLNMVDEQLYMSENNLELIRRRG